MFSPKRVSNLGRLTVPYLFKGSGPEPDYEEWGDSEQAHIKAANLEPNIFFVKSKQGVLTHRSKGLI